MRLLVLQMGYRIIRFTGKHCWYLCLKFYANFTGMTSQTCMHDCVIYAVILRSIHCHCTLLEARNASFYSTPELHTAEFTPKRMPPSFSNGPAKWSKTFEKNCSCFLSRLPIKQIDNIIRTKLMFHV